MAIPEDSGDDALRHSSGIAMDSSGFGQDGHNQQGAFLGWLPDEARSPLRTASSRRQ